ncbi:uncharacterized protein [Panulirus ornatus]|uniref:uncharacterized protein n=1 Tax=Panulirus ornatus TaxID=150431 RepID=UPI003A83E2E1
MSSQPVDMTLSFGLPVDLAKFGTSYLAENPIAGFLVSLLAFFVLVAVLAVPVAALFGVEIFPGIVPQVARSLGGDVSLWTELEKLTGSKVVEDFLSEPLDDFVERLMGGRDARSPHTIGDFLARAAQALTPALSLLDYDNAFIAVQVPGEECQQRLMCHVHSQLPRLPSLLQRAYGYLGTHIKHFERYSWAIQTGLSGSQCDLAFPGCPYNVLQMASSFVPFLRNRNHHTNEL